MPTIEDRMKALWSEVLERPEIPDQADFFALGGSSIKAVLLAALVQERIGVRLDAVEVVLKPQLVELTGLVAGRVQAAG